MQYWHDIVTEKSWKVLQELRGKFKFILIGGWAVYLLARTQKSKDIDVIVDLGTLQQIKGSYDLRKNDRLKKYEIKIDEIDVDIYTPFYSRLAVPPEDVRPQRIEGFDVARPEELLILKQGAWLDRRHSEKGEKDRIDIMSLLFKCGIEPERLKKLLKGRQDEFINSLVSLVTEFSDYGHFSMSPSEFRKRKQEVLERLKRL